MTEEVQAPPTQRRTARGVLTTLAVIAVLAGGAFALTRTGAEAPQGTVHGVELQAFDGEGTVSLSSYAGTPLVVNFWASWCAFCIEEMPAFQEVYASFGGRVAFLGVDLQDDPELAATLVEQTGVRYDLAADPDGSGFVGFEGIGMPTTLFVDEEGTIVERFTGPLTGDALRDRIQRHFDV